MPKKVTKSTAKETPARLKRSASKPEETLEDGITIPASEDAGEEDYLQKYQYGRELPLGDPRTNPREGKPKAMKDALLSQPKVRVMIPVDSGSDPSVPFDVTLNGYRLSLPRNQYIDVPEQVAGVIMNSHNQTNAALEQFKIGGNKAKEDALG
mgnify:CR=1 FL=1